MNPDDADRDDRPPTGLSPTGEPAAPEQVGLAIRAMVAGACAGLGCVSAIMWAMRTLQVTGMAPVAPTPADMIANLILFGLLAGVLVGALVTWGLAAPIASAYRRGGFAMAAGFATLLLSLLTAPVDHFFGRTGLLVLTAGAAGLFLFFLRRLRSQA
ncbi:MAG TPA: hypothetical protein VMG41_07585 [Gemmatimonadales bacterium]|nr:hypothetical protein [Gemmatimonadales bacterium]